MLLAQIHRDCSRAAARYSPAEFVRDLLAGGDAAVADELAREFAVLVARPDLWVPGDGTVEACERWHVACHRLMHAYQDIALEEVERRA